MDEKNSIPNEIKDILVSLHEEHYSFQKCLLIIKNYIDEDPIKNSNNIVEYILNNINVSDIKNNICYYLADLLVYIQDVNKIDNKNYNEEVEKKDDNGLYYPEYRINIKDERLKKYVVKDIRWELIRNCTKNINYLKLMYVVSNNILPKNGYVLFINIFHKLEINYQYKLLSLEYFANIANQIKIERAKYIAQILPLVLEKFYNIEGQPYYNDNINNLDILISMCKFVNILCDESIKAQDDDRQDVALYSIVAFIMRIINYHNVDLPLNRNIEKLFKYINYENVNYRECLKEYWNITKNLYKNKNENLVKDCLSSLIWRLSIINPNLPRTLERVNILIPNTKTCVLENSTLEISILCYLILIEKVNNCCFPLVFSELYLFNLMIRNSYNLILCVSKAKEHIKNNLLIKAYHFICVCSILSQIIKKRFNEYCGNIYKFRWRPYDFLKKIYQILYENSNLKTYTKIVYYCISNIMRNFHWDIFYSLYSKLLVESNSDKIKSTISSFFKDEMFKQMSHIIKNIEIKKLKKKEYELTDNSNHNTNNTEISFEQKSEKKENVECLDKEEIDINKVGNQIRKIVFTLISEESVILYIESITVALNIVKMILLNKNFHPFYKFILKFDESSSCFLQNKIKYFHEQIKIEKAMLLRDKQKDESLSSNNEEISEKYFYINNTMNSVNVNKLEIVVMLLEDIEKTIEKIKINTKN
ncbi:conserved Plasmodium protein, unknown function [Plasmodium gallinaceum]|uniref:Uncharacterized protein n=1 Tax=Plasmodium gallinaceum TaxID=5849 RepID=A0A1J1H1W9_PLAGA|nr:conserved Plasmodium protein, unknown function [Plasmodium gallinaceum]CRG97531.1 conserved Plasmodium protein, unknown function [Plasmodium gallinaceum]